MAQHIEIAADDDRLGLGNTGSASGELADLAELFLLDRTLLRVPSELRMRSDHVITPP
jgi:hypothetical protein